MIADQTSPYEPPTTRDRDGSRRLTVWSFGSVLVLAITVAAYVLLWSKLKELAIGFGMPDTTIDSAKLIIVGSILILQLLPVGAALIVITTVSFAAVFTRGTSKDRVVAVCALVPVGFCPIAALFGPLILNHVLAYY